MLILLFSDKSRRLSRLQTRQICHRSPFKQELLRAHQRSQDLRCQQRKRPRVPYDDLPAGTAEDRFRQRARSRQKRD